jgi:hypothetical protein
MNAGLQQVEITTTNYSEDVTTILDQIPIGPEMITAGIVGFMIWLFVRALGSENRSAWASLGTKGKSKKYNLEIVKKAKDGTSDQFRLVCLGR